MKIAFLCARDMAGIMYNLSEAVNRHTSHEAFHIIENLHENYKFPYQYKMNQNNMAELHRKIYDSDAVVFSEWMGIIEKLKLDRSKLRNKTIALTVGGGGFRLKRAWRNGQKYYRKISGKLKLIACSADFLEKCPRLPWVPRCVRTDWLREQYDYGKRSPPLIAASPSKASDLVNPRMGMISSNFKNIVERLRREGYRFTGRCLSSHRKCLSNDECLRRKAQASIFFDRLYSIYGVNSLEAGAFESAVVTGTSGKALNIIKGKLGSPCPYVVVGSWSGMYSAFRRLLDDPDYMRRVGSECLDYSRKVEVYAANRLIEVLES